MHIQGLLEILGPRLNTDADSKHVLIVEDDPTCESLLRRIVQAVDPHAKISSEESAEQALDALASHGTYDLVIADIFLSGKHSGIELLETCRERFPMTPVLMTSSLPLQRFFQTIGQNAVAPPYLHKPFYVGECKQIIEGLLTSRAAPGG